MGTDDKQPHNSGDPLDGHVAARADCPHRPSPVRTDLLDDLGNQYEPDFPPDRRGLRSIRRREHLPRHELAVQHIGVQQRLRALPLTAQALPKPWCAIKPLRTKACKRSATPHMLGMVTLV